MRVDSISNQNFTSGNIELNRMHRWNLNNYKMIKQIAKDNDVDLFIYKIKPSKYLPHNNSYNVLARKDIEVPPSYKYGYSYVLTDKNADKKEVSNKILAGVYDAVNKLMEKLSQSKTEI